VTGDGGIDPRPDFGYFAPPPGATTTMPAPASAAPSPAAWSTKPWLAVVLVAVLVAVGAIVRAEQMHRGGGLAWGDLSGRTTTQAFGGAPPATLTDHPQRVLPPVHTTTATGYAFDTVIDGNPVRWDACLPIHYVVSGAEPFTGANALLKQVLAEVSAASGLAFVDDGATTEPALPSRASYQPARYGRTWAPVLVAWTDQSAVPQLAGNVIGLGGAAMAKVHGQPRLVSGIVYFDAPELSLIALQANGYAEMRTVMLHEIGHLVGLGHVQDAGEVMFPSNNGQGDYGPGDRAGLAFAGSATCPRWS
jgi:hypothetical protein